MKNHVNIKFSLQKFSLLYQLVIIDTDEKKVKGEVMDLQTGCSFLDGVEICGGTGKQLTVINILFFKYFQIIR